MIFFQIGATTGGVNPKINNMLQGYKVAKYDLIWINDSALFGKLPGASLIYCTSCIKKWTIRKSFSSLQSGLSNMYDVYDSDFILV